MNNEEKKEGGRSSTRCSQGQRPWNNVETTHIDLNFRKEMPTNTKHIIKGSSDHKDFKTNTVSDPEIVMYASREELNDLIGNAPGWLLRSGIMMIALVTILVLGMSAVISYPDKIIATGIVTTTRPPMRLVAHRTGRIEHILIENGRDVIKGTPLLYLDNTADVDDINQLIKWISQYQKKDNSLPPPSELTLGTLQFLYAQLTLVYSEYHEVKRQRGTQSQISTIVQEMGHIDRLNLSISQEEKHFSTEQNLAEKEYKRSQGLYKEGLIALQELEIAESKYNQFLRQLENVNKSKIQNSIRKDQLELDRKRLAEDRSTQLQQYRFRLQEIISQLKGAYNQWKQDNYIISEVDGKIDYHMDITEQYTLQQGLSIGYVIPQNKVNKKYIKAIAPALGIAKLDSHSRAIIKIDAYPYKEYGAIEATLEAMSLVPYHTEEGVAVYQIKMPLTDTLRTNYNKVLDYRPDMTASIELITEDKSILSRIFEQFLDLIYNQ